MNDQTPPKPPKLTGLAADVMRDTIPETSHRVALTAWASDGNDAVDAAIGAAVDALIGEIAAVLEHEGEQP